MIYCWNQSIYVPSLYLFSFSLHCSFVPLFFLFFTINNLAEISTAHIVGVTDFSYGNDKNSCKTKKKKWFYEHIANGCITNVNCWLSQQQEKGLRVFVGSENGRRSSCKTGYFKWCRVVKKTFPRSLSCKMTTYYTDCCLTHCFFFHQLIDVSVIHLKYKLFLMFYHPPLHSNVVRKRKKKNAHATCNLQFWFQSFIHSTSHSFIHSVFWIKYCRKKNSVFNTFFTFFFVFPFTLLPFTVRLCWFLWKCWPLIGWRWLWKELIKVPVI